MSRHEEHSEGQLGCSHVRDVTELGTDAGVTSEREGRTLWL